MLKRVLIIGLALGVGIAALYVGTAQAQWQYLRPPGMWWYYGTIDGCASITKVRNPDTQPAILRCDIDLTRIETLCFNKNNHDVRPGEAATQVVVFNPIGQEELEKKDKKKGKANVCVGVDETELGSDVLCVNRNWIVIDALTTEFLANCTTEQCTGEDDPNTEKDETCETTVVKDTQVCQCRLPAGFTVEFPPEPCANPLQPDENCTAYICDELEWDEINEVWVPTGRECKFLE